MSPLDPARPIVLHVDDNDADLELTQLAIKEIAGEALRYLGMSDGDAALRLLRDLVQPPPQRVALLVLDINIPRLTGWEILTAVHEDDRLRHIPVVMLSGSRATTDVARAQTYGVRYVVKPATYSQLVSEIHQILGAHQLLSVTKP